MMTTIPADAGLLLKPSEVARMFRVDPKTVSRWAASGKLTSVRTPGGHRRFPLDGVQEMLAVATGHERQNVSRWRPGG